MVDAGSSRAGDPPIGSGHCDEGEARAPDYRLIAAAASAWGGSLIGLVGSARLVAAALLLLGAFLAVGFVTGVLLSARVWPTALAGVMIAAMALGVASVAAERFQKDPAALAAERGQPIRAHLTLITDPAQRTSAWGQPSLTANAVFDSIKVDGGWVPSRARVQVRTALGQRLQRGDQVEAYGTIDTGYAARSPSVGVLDARSISTLQPAGRWQASANRVKDRLRWATEGLPPHARGLIAGMAVGDDRLVEADLRDAMLTTSLTHLTAVSGSHIAIVLGLLAVLIPGYRWARAGAMAGFLVLLVTVVGPQPSVLRATWCALIVGLGLMMRRASQPQIALAAVVIGSVFLSPWLAKDFGFALSVLATWGILFSGRPRLARIRARRTEKDASVLGRFRLAVIQATVVAFAAGIWVLPVTLLLNPWLPVWGVVANVLAGPAIAPITVLGLLAAALSAWFPWASVFLCTLAVPFTHWVSLVATFCASLPGARLPWVQGVGGIVLAAGLIGLMTVWELRTKGNEATGGRTGSISHRSEPGTAGAGDAGSGERGRTGRPHPRTHSPPRHRARPKHRTE